MDIKSIPLDPQTVTMEFNDVFQYIGDTGLYQILLYMILGLCSFFNGMHNMSSNFFAGPMDHWCRIPRLANFSFDTQKYVGVPYEDGDADVYDSCHMFDLNYSSFTDEEILTWDRSLYSNTSTIECTGWVFDQREFIDTINSKYELVCSKNWMGELTSTIYMFGVLIGSVGSGSLSDRFGRKWIMMGALVGYVSFGVAQGFAPNYPAFVVFRFLVATFSMTAFLCAYVIVMELLGPRHYVLLATFVHVFFSVGFMLVAGIGYAIREIRYFFMAISIPVACTFPFIWAVPESPRWQIANGRSKKADKTLRYIAKVNRTTFPENVKWVQSKAQEETGQKKGTCGDLCSSTILCRELALIYLNWFTVSLVYYGVSFNAGAFGDVYLNTFLSGLIEVPGNIICFIAMEKGGRRWSNGGSLLVTGVFCLALIPILIVRPDMESLLTALSTLGKGAITFSFSSVYTYSSELFPTPVRHLALGSASMFARIGSMASPYLGSTLEDVWKPMPSVIFGVLAVFTGAIVFILPETKGHPVPDTIEEAEEIGRFRKKGIVKKPDDQNDLVIVVPEPEMKESNGKINEAFTTFGTDSVNFDKGDKEVEAFTRL